MTRRSGSTPDDAPALAAFVALVDVAPLTAFKEDPAGVFLRDIQGRSKAAMPRFSPDPADGPSW
jgi:hypothetical protein